DFSRGPMLLDYLPFPGWSNHGGDGDGHIDDGYLELDLGNDWRRHNRFFVPSESTSIEFYFWVTDRTETGDEFLVYLGEEIPANVIGILSLDFEHSGWEVCDIPLDKRGTVPTLTFKITSSSSVSSQVRIDDVRLVVDSGGPPNDECSNAIPILYGVSYHGSTISATGTDITVCTSNDTTDVWHLFTPLVAGPYLISLQGSDYNTSLAVFDTCGGTELACNDDYYPGNVSRAIVDMVEGETYYIRVSGYNGSTGDYTLVVSLAADVTKNGVVDFKDLDTLVDSWLLENTPSDVDIAPVDSLGELINFLDYAVLAEYWHMDLTP
ncbi:MAG: hypothetical protein KAV87_40665, partial [Desulfobacteraceae bacterium]|nr:hypothetical protein [Desulfobacteraceae bacterium]